MSFDIAVPKEIVPQGHEDKHTRMMHGDVVMVESRNHSPWTDI
jgi:hypothetical protein